MRVKFLCVVAIGLALVLSATWVGPSGKQIPRSATGFSIVPLDPDLVGALRKQGKALRYPFPNSVNQGNKFNPDGSVIEPLTLTPQQKILVIFVEFTTPPPGGPTSRLNLTYFDDMLFGTVYDPPEYASYSPHPTDRTLRNYFREVSYNSMDVVTLNLPSVMGWAQSGHSYDYYCKADGIHDNSFGPYPENIQGLVIDAVKALDPFIDFSQYAVNGEVPNLFVVHAGTGAEWSGDPGIIWSHSWNLSAGTGLNGYVADGVKINKYATMPEVGGDLTGFTGLVRGPYPPTVGVYAHEYSHVLGVPDQYDYGYESDGTGVYSLMAGGSWNRYPNYTIFNGNSPAHLDAWSKFRLGFVDPQEILSSQNVTLPPVETESIVYKMVVPNSGGKEYFLFENRQQTGYDQGLARYGAHGLAIYHIDDTVLDRVYSRPNEAENWKEFRSEGWRKAWTGETHYAVSLIQADDLWELEHGSSYLNPASYAGDLYPGLYGVTSFSSYTRPNSSNYYFWAGSEPKFGFSGVTVANIQETGGVIAADLSFVPWASKK